MQLKRVVITGIGTINPIGNDVAEFFSALDEGKSGASLLTAPYHEVFKTKFACQVSGFNFSDYGFDRKEERKNDRYAQLALVAADQAVKDSAVDLANEDLTRIGVVIGSGVGGIMTTTQEILDCPQEGPLRFSPFLIPKIITDIASGQISIKYGFRGPNFSVTAACATSAMAVAQGCQLIQLSRADMMLVGGSEAPLCVSGVGGFNAMHALSTRNDDYLTASRPFDKNRDGFVMAEGASLLMIEDYEHAVRRGAKIYAEIAGLGMTADAYHMTAPDPEGAGAVAAMKLALDDAGVGLEDIDYINAHGTSTYAGDIAEAKAIKTLFGPAAYKLNVSSTKSMTGHLLGAAGATELLVCIHAMRDGIIPPTINFSEEDDAIDYNINFTFNKPQRRKVDVALSNNFGFGGHNASIVLKKIQ